MLYALIVVLANRNQVAVNFVFFKTEASLFVVLVLAIALGFVAGWLFDDLRDRRKRQRERRVATPMRSRAKPRDMRSHAAGDASSRRAISSEARSATPSEIRSGVS